MKAIKVLVFAIGLTLLFNCEQETIYRYESVKRELQPFLQPELADVFQYSDTLIIYDTTYFNHSISTLNAYKNHLEAKDSTYNNLIINRLQEIETSKTQTKHPNLYLSGKSIKANFESEKRDIEKIMRFLIAYPKQLEAAKNQLTKPNALHTQLTINQLTELFAFVSNDLTNHLKVTKAFAKHQITIANTQLAIKDYIAFLNSKLLNEEVD
jgi:ATP-dependent Lon protease